MILIDGSVGEGGGQILRTALGLSVVTGQPFRIERIRAGRKTPGLLRQHLTAALAAKEISDATVEGAELGSLELTFAPGPVRPGNYRFAVGSAGSVTLVLQTILPALLTASAPTTLTLEGGTHNPFAPPFDFLVKSFLPLVHRKGPRVTASLECYGFYPAGGGRFTVTIDPVPKLKPLEILERGEITARTARVVIAKLSREIAEREAKTLARKLSIAPSAVHIEETPHSNGPGNVVMVELNSRHVTEVFTAFAERGVPAEEVANAAVKEARHYESAEVPVGEHLADQLMIPLALAGGGAYVTGELSSHSTTNIETIQRFLPVRFNIAETERRKFRVSVSA